MFFTNKDILSYKNIKNNCNCITCLTKFWFLQQKLTYIFYWWAFRWRVNAIAFTRQRKNHTSCGILLWFFRLSYELFAYLPAELRLHDNEMPSNKMYWLNLVFKYLLQNVVFNFNFEYSIYSNAINTAFKIT